MYVIHILCTEISGIACSFKHCLKITNSKCVIITNCVIDTHMFLNIFNIHFLSVIYSAVFICIYSFRSVILYLILTPAVAFVVVSTI